MYHIFVFLPLVEILSKNILPLFLYLFPVYICKYIQFSILFLKTSVDWVGVKVIEMRVKEDLYKTKE
jgi:hypothetical protein